MLSIPGGISPTKMSLWQDRQAPQIGGTVSPLTARDKEHNRGLSPGPEYVKVQGLSEASPMESP